MPVKPQHVIVVLAAAGAAWLAWRATMQSGGAPVPKFSEDANNVIAYHLADVSEIQHVTWTRHRYPPRVGGEITAIISKGWSAASVPCVPGSEWMTRPPANDALLSS